MNRSVFGSDCSFRKDRSRYRMIRGWSRRVVVSEAASRRSARMARKGALAAMTGLSNRLAVDAAGFIWMAEPKVPSLHRVTLRRQDRSSSCRSVAVSYPCIRQKGGRLPEDARRPAYQRRVWAARQKRDST